MKQSSDENINQTQEQVEQLIIERDELLRKNENLTRGLMQFNDKVKQVHLLYNQKTDTYHKNTIAFRTKIKQYEAKIQQLQKQLDKFNSVNNNSNNNNFEGNMINDINDNSNNNFYNYGKKGYISGSRLNDKNKNNPRYNMNDKRVLMDNNYNLSNRGKQIYDNNNIINKRNLTYELRESQKDKENEEQNDLSQKKYLENFKSYLSNLNKF